MEDRENKETHLGDTEYRNLTKIDLASFNIHFPNWASCQKHSRSFFLHSATVCHGYANPTFCKLVNFARRNYTYNRKTSNHSNGDVPFPHQKRRVTHERHKNQEAQKI